MRLANSKKEIIKQGFVPGIIATLCCLGPLLLIMLGLVSASSALAISAYSPYFIPIGLLVLVISLIYAIKKRRAIICNGCQDTGQERRKLVYFVVLSVIVAVVTYMLVYYLVLPKLTPVILNNFRGA